MDYRQFRMDTGITVKDMVEVLKDVCPKYSRSIQCFADQPDKYGLCLLPSLEKLLVERFGPCKDTPPAPKSKSKPQRTKPHRLVVYLSDDLNEKVVKIRAAQGCTTQELLSDLIENWLVTTAEE